MTEIEDIKPIIMGGVDQPLLDPHNLMVNVDKRPTIDELERQIGRLEHRNTYLKRENEQLRELTNEMGKVCVLVATRAEDGTGRCTYCWAGGVAKPQHSTLCLWTAATKALELKAKLDIPNKHLGGE